MQLVRLAAGKGGNVRLYEGGSGGLMGFAKGLTGKNGSTISVERRAMRKWTKTVR